MKVTLPLIVAATATVPGVVALLVRRVAPWPVTFVLTHIAVSGYCIALAASPPLASHTTWLLGKKANGDIPLWSWVLWWPYHVGLQTKLAVQRRTRTEPTWSIIAPGWWLGSWCSTDQQLPVGNLAILDCTCELPLRHSLLPYLCLPTWDTYAPTVEQIDGAVDWALAQKAAGLGVYVHCAHGHGRSNVVLSALLIAAGTVHDTPEAVEIMKRGRPKARLNARQRQRLLEWEASRIIQKKA